MESQTQNHAALEQEMTKVMSNSTFAIEKSTSDNHKFGYFNNAWCIRVCLIRNLKDKLGFQSSILETQADTSISHSFG